jgi:hypothetical protein
MLALTAITEGQQSLAANGAQDENRTHDLRITRTMKVNMVRHPGSQSPRKQTSCLNGYAGGDPETVGDVQ